MTQNDIKSIYRRYGKKSADLQRIMSLNYPSILLSERSSKKVTPIDNIAELNALEFPIKNIVITGASANFQDRISLWRKL